MITTKVAHQAVLFSGPDANTDKSIAKDSDISSQDNFKEIVEGNSDNEEVANCDKPDLISTFKVVSSILKEITKLYVKESRSLNEWKESNDLESIKKYADIYFFVLNTLQNRLEDKVENLTKEIAYLDINKAGAVDTILANAGAIEKLRGLEDITKQFLQNLEPELKAGESAIKLGQHIEEDLGIQIESFISQIEQTPEEPTITPIQDLELNQLENKTNTKSSEVTESKITETSNKEAHSENSTINYKTDSSTDNKGGDSHDKEGKQDSRPEVKLVDLLADQDQPDMALSYSSNSTIINSNPIKLTAKVETININELSNHIESHISEAPRNSHQEIKLQLNPENHGRVDLTIIKNENNEISVKLVFHNKESLELVRQDLKDNILELREVLKSKNLDLSKFEVGESNASNTAHGGDSKSSSFNEAKEEQHKRLYHSLPEWVKDGESTKQASFGSILEGI